MGIASDRMTGKLYLVVLVVVILVALCGPLFEIIDQWDQSPQGGDDIQFTIFAVVACIGAALASVGLVFVLFSRWRRAFDVSAIVKFLPPPAPAVLYTSSPGNLRI